MKPVLAIVVIVGIFLVSVFVISEIIWYFANEEFEKARGEFLDTIKYLINLKTVQ